MNVPIEQPRGHGFIQPVLDVGRDYIFGVENPLGREVINESGDWTSFLPSGEFQAPRFETSACTCFGTTNALETLMNYVFGVEANLSDRMVAKGINVNPAKGAVPKNAADFLRKNWSVQEESWPMDGVQTVDEYYKPLPDILYKEAKQDKGEYSFGYQWVNPSLSNLREALKRGTVCMSVSLWLGEDGKYYRPQNWVDSHWLQLVRVYDNGDMLVNDSYAPFLKTIKAGFTPQASYLYTLNEEITDAITLLIRQIKKWLGLV